ncbi:hypothetical protein [Streptomyces olivoreticuli]|uniref:hypothetical protein n=1 Tax=Streptomyces olivoreticuli TaxID=68246 RepID=UPI000E2780FD
MLGQPPTRSNLVSSASASPDNAEAMIERLDHHDIPLSGTQGAVVGSSVIVGNPLAHPLLKRDVTVTGCHSHRRGHPYRHRRASGPHHPRLHPTLELN